MSETMSSGASSGVSPGAPGATAGSSKPALTPWISIPLWLLLPMLAALLKIPVPEPLRRYKGWIWLGFAAVIFGVGVWFRYVYIYRLHNPNDYVYSDMKMYVDLARRLNQPGYKLNIGDITHPPGNTWLLQYFMRSDPTKLTGLVRLQFIVASLVPLTMGFLAWVAFPAKHLRDAAGKLPGFFTRLAAQRTAQVAVIAGSLYFPYIDFGGYYLAEIHMTFTGTLTIAFYLLGMRLVAEPDPEVAPAAQPPSGFVEHLIESLRRRPARIIGAFAAMAVGGFLFSFAMALKMVAMLAIGGFMVTHFLFAKRPRWIFKLVLPAMFLLAAAPLTREMVSRCTEANRDPNNDNKPTFCTGSNKSAADFLLGHKGRIQGIEWRDPKVPGVVGFGNPAAYQHGYREKAVVPFLITNQAENNKAAWDWVKKNKGEALVLSFEHVWDSFGGSYPWPPNATKIWPFSYAFHFLFLVFILFPALVRLTDVLRERGVVGLVRSDEFILLSPIFGVCAAVFVATGEVRYRIPWDPVFFVLAIEFYRKITYRFWEPAVVVVGPSVPAITTPTAESDEDEDHSTKKPDAKKSDENAPDDEAEATSAAGGS